MVRAAAFAVALALAVPAFAQGQPPSRNPADAPAGTYVLDKTHASLVAKVGHKLLSKSTFRFEKFDARIDYDPANPKAARLTVTVDPRSISSGMPNFDAEREGERFLNAQAHPEIRFVSTAVRPGEGPEGKVDGELTFLGVTRPVTLDVTFNGTAKDMRGRPTMGFSGFTRIDRKDFGLTALPGVIGDEIAFLIEAEFNKQ